MEFNHFTLENCSNADGLVVVIDVLRAFSTTAYAFAAGADEIYLVSTVEEAFNLKDTIKNSRIMGEVDGIRVDGFDFGNSPSQFEGINLSGVPLIQRTTSGTQGVVLSQKAGQILTTSFCNAQATANYIAEISPRKVSFIITGMRPDGWGDEDLACAQYIENLLMNKVSDLGKFVQRVLNSKPGRLFLDIEKSEYPKKDLDYCLKVNIFNSVMEVRRSKEHLLLQSFTL